MAELLWSAPREWAESCRLKAFLDRFGLADYDAGLAWSVSPGTRGEFWRGVVEHLGLPMRNLPTQVVTEDPSHPSGVRWFSGCELNYAEAALVGPSSSAEEDPLCLIGLSQTRPGTSLTRSALLDLVGALRGRLAKAGVGQGDCVVGYLPNVVEAVACLLATASLGATWSCCSPEMGVPGALDRLGQLHPKVLFSVDGYRYGDKVVDRLAQAEQLRKGLGELSLSVMVPYLHPTVTPPPGWEPWSRAVSEPAALAFEPVGFDHPLYVLYSSGTTGKPKAIVHGHGAMLVEHAKALALHFDLGPSDRFFWFSSTSWMMWNFLVSGLLVGATVVLFDGDPTWPTPQALWELMATTTTTVGGVSASFLAACERAGLNPRSLFDLSRLKVLGSTGSPLSARAARWVYEAASDQVMLASFSGGTDVCSGFVGTSPLHPVWAGEISAPCLGAAVDVFDDSGRPVREAEGELVLTQPLPSMPVRFVDDPGHRRYREAYFERFPGVWAHGDRAKITARGTFVISGRSDGTLNRGGVRMGTAEFYSVVEALPGVLDSVVVHLEDPAGGPGELWLLVVADSSADHGELERLVKEALRKDLSPRHVPDRIAFVTALPRTLSGKKLEVPIKKILLGAHPDQVVSASSITSPESLAEIASLARRPE